MLQFGKISVRAYYPNDELSQPGLKIKLTDKHQSLLPNQDTCFLNPQSVSTPASRLNIAYRQAVAFPTTELMDKVGKMLHEIENGLLREQLKIILNNLPSWQGGENPAKESLSKAVKALGDDEDFDFNDPSGFKILQEKFHAVKQAYTAWVHDALAQNI